MTEQNHVFQDEFKKFLLTLKEGSDIELKSASDLPKSFWETYSSFSNTEGGLIALGVEEGEQENVLIGSQFYDMYLKVVKLFPSQISVRQHR